VAAPPSSSEPVELSFRSEVSRLRAGERRRLFPLTLHIGTPDGAQQRLEVPWPMPSELDQGLRFDLADALVGALASSWPEELAAWGWVTRPGVPELHDYDLAWFSVVSRAMGAHGLALAGFRAVTRTGWLDVTSGAGRTWKRLRR
jgi:hypothetical protein